MGLEWTVSWPWRSDFVVQVSFFQVIGQLYLPPCTPRLCDMLLAWQGMQLIPKSGHFTGRNFRSHWTSGRK